MTDRHLYSIPPPVDPGPVATVERPDHRSAQDRWVMAGVEAATNRLNPAPETVLEISVRPFPRLRDASFTGDVDIATTIVDDHTGDLSGFDDRSCDLSVSIAVLGWMAPVEVRHRAIAEHLRIARRSLIINVDWTVTEGGPAFNRLRDMMSTVLRPKGFNPYYGLLQHCEVALVCGNRGRVESEAISVGSLHHPEVMVEAAEQVLTGLTGRDRIQADQLITATRREIRAGVPHRLPDIVATLFTASD